MSSSPLLSDERLIVVKSKLEPAYFLKKNIIVGVCFEHVSQNYKLYYFKTSKRIKKKKKAKESFNENLMADDDVLELRLNIRIVRLLLHITVAFILF